MHTLFDVQDLKNISDPGNECIHDREAPTNISTTWLSDSYCNKSDYKIIKVSVGLKIHGFLPSPHLISIEFSVTKRTNLVAQPPSSPPKKYLNLFC